jgi:hypothetical protein
MFKLDHVFEISTTVFLAVVMISGGMMISGKFGIKTTNDSAEFLNDLSQAEVLGASDTKEDQSQCSKEYPIIGWITYEGQKLIVNKLPKNENPSKCFKTLEEAKIDGWSEE